MKGVRYVLLSDASDDCFFARPLFWGMDNETAFMVDCMQKSNL